MEWTKQTYNSQYNKWVPWAEDMYLYYFTKDNKASYATKGNLQRTTQSLVTISLFRVHRANLNFAHR